jgi:hypothetical protein
MSKMASHEPFGHLQPKLWAKERSGVKLAIWPRPLKVGNRPLPDVYWGSATWVEENYNFGSDLTLIGVDSQEIWAPKVLGLQPEIVSRLLLRSPEEKEPFGCNFGGELQSILYGGRWWLTPSPGRGESSVSKCPWLVPTPKGVPKCELTLLWLVLDADSSLII